MRGIPHRYLTERYPGVGGSIKENLEDFRVTEVPLYSPSDRGEHTYVEIRKYDLSTLEALERLARALGIGTEEIGYAGLKDRKAITRQVLSIRGVSPEQILTLRLSQIEILWARRHTNKLRIGHLRGNRFRIRVRRILSDSRSHIEPIVAALRRVGMPNYYGPQRFGNRGDAFLIGRSLLLHENRTAVKRILGHPSRSENNPCVIAARQRFMAGDIRGALELFPRSYRTERTLLGYLLQAGDNHRGAVRRITPSLKKIYYSAYQSYLFNRILDRRLELVGPDLGRILEGDLAFLHRNGAVFEVIRAEEERDRAARFEISPSGPLFGKAMPWPRGLEHDIEVGVLAGERIRPTLFHQLLPSQRMRGGRRPLRVELQELKWELDGRDLLLEFFLPKGSYATTFLREILKNDEPPICYYTERQEDVPTPEAVDPAAAVIAPPREDASRLDDDRIAQGGGD